MEIRRPVIIPDAAGAGKARLGANKPQAGGGIEERRRDVVDFSLHPLWRNSFSTPGGREGAPGGGKEARDSGGGRKDVLSYKFLFTCMICNHLDERLLVRLP